MRAVVLQSDWEHTCFGSRAKAIRLAAITIDPTGIVGKGKLLKEFKEDRRKIVFSPPRRLATFALHNDLQFPIQYQVVFILPENDRGDIFAEKVNLLLQHGKAVAVAMAKSLDSTSLEAIPDIVANSSASWATVAEEIGRGVVRAQAWWDNDDVSVRRRPC
jgi:hypothetical protein